MNLSGRTRLLIRTPEYSVLTDVDRGGRALLGAYQSAIGIKFHQAGDIGVRVLMGLDLADVLDISAAGKYLLVNQIGESEGRLPRVYLRPTDGSPAVRLGNGLGRALSPDGKWVSVVREKQGVLIPTGAGQERTIAIAALEGGTGTVLSWLPDSQSYIIFGNEVGKQRRFFVWNSSTGALRAITPEGSGGAPLLSPDGRKLLYQGQNRNWYSTPVAGGKIQVEQTLKPTDRCLHWKLDGESVFAANPWNGPVLRIYLVNLKTGTRTLWKEIRSAPGDESLSYPNITPDGKSYVYQNRRVSGDIYPVEGLK